ncbi:hypothetical protein [Enterobacter cloacae complex sp. SHL020]|uniref:hypothetical protein n=1 Tax=Enterobacter cloacae complex sp. SHL020 TaxID=3412401 RepID=UPI003BA04953
MRKLNTPPSELICDMFTSERARMIYTVLGNLVQCAIRIIIFRPLFLFSCLASVVMAAVPVAVFISPAYTPEVLNAGLLRTLRLLPDAYIPLCLAGLLFELVFQVRKIVGSHHDWPDIAGKGRGQ